MKKAKRKAGSNRKSSDMSDGTGLSEDETVRVEPDRAQYNDAEASARLVTTRHRVLNFTQRAQAIKLKCTDLDNFEIRPGTAVVKAGGSVTIVVGRKPHQARKNQRLDIYYTPIDGAGGAEKPDVRALFRERGLVESVSITLCQPSADVKPSGHPPNRPSEERHRSAPSLSDCDDTHLSHKDAQRPRGKVKVKKAHPVTEESGDMRRRKKPPPLVLEDPHLRCIFFPPFDEANEISFTVTNPSETQRMAVKMKCNGDLEQFQIKPSGFFLNPKASEIVRVKRLGLGPPSDFGKEPDLLVLYNAEAGKEEVNWRDVFADAKLGEISEVQVELEVRNDPYFDCKDSTILFYKPHSPKSIASLSINNISPFYALAKCYCGNNDVFRLNPVRMLVGPGKTQVLHFTVTKTPNVETKIQLDYVKTTPEIGQREPRDKDLVEIVDAAIKRRETKEKIYELHAVLRPSDAYALLAKPDVVRMSWNEAASAWTATVRLFNQSSACIVVKVSTLEPRRYIMNMAKLALEAGEERELTVTEAVSEAARPGPISESAIKLEFAFRLSIRQRPEVSDVTSESLRFAVLKEAAATKDAIASIRLNVRYDIDTYPFQSPHTPILPPKTPLTAK